MTATTPILSYQGKQRIVVRAHPESGSVSIDISPARIRDFLHLKSHTHPTVVTALTSIFLLIFVAGEWIYLQLQGDDRQGGLLLFETLMGLSMLFASVALFFLLNRRARTYIRASSEELLISETGRSAATGLRIPRSQIESVDARPPRGEFGPALRVVRKRYDSPDLFLRNHNEREIREVAGALNEVLALSPRQNQT